MITLQAVRKLAHALEGVDEKPHFEKISFRVKNKIFATVDVKANVVVLNFLKSINPYFLITIVQSFIRCRGPGVDKAGRWWK